MEYGINFSKGLHRLRQQITSALEDAENELTTVARSALWHLYNQLLVLDKIIEETTSTLSITQRKLMPVYDSKRYLVSVGW